MLKLDPANWSVITWRVFGVLVLIVDLSLIVTVILLGNEGVATHRTAVASLASVTLLLDFLFVWLVVVGDQGYRKGFLIALGSIALLLILFTAWGAIIKRILP